MEYNDSSEASPLFSTYDRGREVFEDHMRPYLRLWAQWASVLVKPLLSNRCFHHHGGSKLCLRELQLFLKPTDFVYKTDIYSYYASISHTRLYRILYSLALPLRFIHLVANYCTRCIVGPHVGFEAQQGIAKGGALSPLLAAVYLYPLDCKMQRWMLRGDVFYARFQDDIIIVARKKSVFKRVIKILRKYLDEEAVMGLRREKTFIGRAHAGFDFLGYHVLPGQLRPSTLSILRAADKAKRCYAQGGRVALAGYLRRWERWACSGLPGLVSEGDATVAVDLVVTAPSTRD